MLSEKCFIDNYFICHLTKFIKLEKTQETMIALKEIHKRIKYDWNDELFSKATDGVIKYSKLYGGKALDISNWYEHKPKETNFEIFLRRFKDGLVKKDLFLSICDDYPEEAKKYKSQYENLLNQNLIENKTNEKEENLTFLPKIKKIGDENV